MAVGDFVGWLPPGFSVTGGEDEWGGIWIHIKDEDGTTVLKASCVKDSLARGDGSLLAIIWHEMALIVAKKLRLRGLDAPTYDEVDMWVRGGFPNRRAMADEIRQYVKKMGGWDEPA